MKLKYLIVTNGVIMPKTLAAILGLLNTDDVRNATSEERTRYLVGLYKIDHDPG